jgi:ketosteroid isomerase-like protein
MSEDEHPLPGEAFERAVARLHAAMARVARGDVAGIKALHSHAPDVTGFYGWGGYEKGWEAVDGRWDWAGQQFKGGTVSYQNLSTMAADGLACTTDIETFHVPPDAGGGPTSRSNRVTHVFRREDGVWRLVHRHASRLEDQYQPGARAK